MVLPPGHLQDVMKSVISNDEKMQEASVSDDMHDLEDDN